MQIQERHEKILEQARRDGTVWVRELADQFSVTEDCIRKDLAALSRKNLLTRIHGGARPIRENPHAFTTGERADQHQEEKEQIASRALELIQPGMTIFLGISTITLALARLIQEAGLSVNVVTNMVGILNVFAAPSKARLLFLGGTLNHGRDGFTGTETIEQIHHFRFDMAFMGAVGIDLTEEAVSTYDMEDGLTKKAVLDVARKTYLLAEQQKLQQEGNYVFARPEEFTAWICNGELSNALKKEAAHASLSLLD